MAEQFVEVKKNIKNKETGETEVKVTKYRVDADFKPTKASDIVAEYIMNWCEANNQIPWLLNLVNTPVTDKNGKVGKIQFVSLRAKFVEAFFPELREVKTVVKKETFIDIINKRFAK